MTRVEASPATASRLIDPTGPLSYARHLEIHGPIPVSMLSGAERFLTELKLSGLTGRGGAGFPLYRKLYAVRAVGRRPTVVVNAMESEPASAKDHFLLWASPHLVLDGMELVSQVVGAQRVVICVPDDRESVATRLASALAEHPPRHGLEIEIMSLSARYVAGEESALVTGLGGGVAIPRYRPDKAVPLALGRQPAVVHNVETLAHAALVARYGAEWFSRVGTPEAPGTTLVTISGEVQLPGVVEVEIGTPIADILRRAMPSQHLRGVLVGGYGGSWLAGDELSTRYAPKELGALGASMGAGVLLPISADACGIRETERITRFMAAESAGQCGPCLFGLPAIADDLRAIADGNADVQALERLIWRCQEVDGRGACRHPDGVARLVRSALRVFSADVAYHLDRAPCAGARQPTVLPLTGSVPKKH